jgi:hypothetical protein
MQRVRFVRYGRASTTAAHSTIVALNAVQDAFCFDLDIDELPLPAGEPPYDDIAMTRALTASVASKHAASTRSASATSRSATTTSAPTIPQEPW